MLNRFFVVVVSLLCAAVAFSVNVSAQKFHSDLA
jgi:hypothetical protein